ncbi:NUDIX domain-containing protein [Thioclava sp. GXIMD2076]|uniref:NUDIX domain-containing protein n=1 Tax=Thioclava kandeliae TaxID=3070818 RepID=A0ABV1SGB7_9RHOB
MTQWRPAPRIRFKVLGLHWRDGRLLAAEVPDDAGRVKGVRPLGGTVEFGETAEAALRREFHEELGVEIGLRGAPVFIENLYHHEGHQGHEILALYEITLPEGAFEGETRLQFHEDSGVVCFAQWFDPATLDQDGGPKLFPDGLKALLKRLGS